MNAAETSHLHVAETSVRRTCCCCCCCFQQVTAFPEVIDVQRDSEGDEFIVLACDGIWDVMSSQEVVDKVREYLVDGRPQVPCTPFDFPTCP